MRQSLTLVKQKLRLSQQLQKQRHHGIQNLQQVLPSTTSLADHTTNLLEVQLSLAITNLVDQLLQATTSQVDLLLLVIIAQADPEIPVEAGLQALQEV